MSSKSNFRTLVKVLLSLGCISSINASATVYEGFIADEPIVMEIQATEYGLYGAYFFIDDGKNILLSRDPNNQHILIEENHFQGDSGFYFDSLQSPIEGYWFDEALNVKKPFSIKEIIHPPIDINNTMTLQKLSKQDLYDYLRQKTFSIQDTVQENIDGEIIQWHKEKCTDLTYFTRVPSEGELIQDLILVNNYLEMKFREYLSQTYGCEQSKYVVQPTYLNDKITSFFVRGSYLCEGESTKIFHRELINVENETGKKLALSDLIDIPENSTEEVWITEQLNTLYPEKMSDQECPYLDPQTWKLDPQDGWLVTKEGIELRPEFPEMISNCSATEWAILPFELLKDHQDEKNLLEL